MTISADGGRVLGCLIEKQLTTPQQYPLSANALVAACNQSTNRHPVMALEEERVVRVLDELKALRLVRFVLPAHGRSVTRYRHVVDEVYGLDSGRLALVGLLLLRGPLTSGELRARTGRMAEFASVGAVHHELEALAEHPDPLVRLLPRRPGQKEDRWQQLLAAESGSELAAGAEPAGPAPPEGEVAPIVADRAADPGPTDQSSATGSARSAGAPGQLEHRFEELIAEVAELRRDVDRLRGSLDTLRRRLGD